MMQKQMCCKRCKKANVGLYVVEYEQANMDKKDYYCQTCYDDIFYGQDQMEY